MLIVERKFGSGKKALDQVHYIIKDVVIKNMVKQTKEQSPNKPSKNNSELQDSGLFLDRTGMAGSDNTQTKEQRDERNR